MLEIRVVTDLPEQDRDLVYRCCETAVFAPRHLAAWVDQIHRALHESTTWGEFKANMPSEEYERLFGEKFGESGDGEEVPSENDPFDAYDITGVADGDYPMWLAAHMDEWIPRELLLRFGEHSVSTINGNFWEIPETRAKALAKELRVLGYKVTASTLTDWY